MKFKIGERQAAIPSGEYHAVLWELKETQLFKKRHLVFTFEIRGGLHHGMHLRGFINADYDSFSPFTKLWKWAAAVAEGDMDPGDELDTEIFWHKILKVRVETKISKKTGNPFSNVTEIEGVVIES